MIKIFSDNKIIYLIDNPAIFKAEEKSVLVNIQSAVQIAEGYTSLINKNGLHEIYFFNNDLRQLFSYFSAMFRIIEAAGGLVKNNKGECLFIFRNGKWDLPKGKIEKGEGVKEAAVREVEEECGISGLTILRELIPTYHTYFIKEKAILKRTFWFEMFCDDTSVLVPQTEEGITAVQWIAAGNLKKVYNNTFESIKEVLSSAT